MQRTQSVRKRGGKVGRNPDFKGWANPKGKEFSLKSGETHGWAAEELLAEFYPEWNWRAEESGWSSSIKALERKGWVRVVGNGNYSVWSLIDPFTGRMRRNLLDLMTTEDENDKVYIDAYEGDVISGRTAGYVLDKYQ